MTSKRIETALSEEVYVLVKEVASMWGMTVKSYIAKSITEAALADNERFQRIFGEVSDQSLGHQKNQNLGREQRRTGDCI